LYLSIIIPARNEENNIKNTAENVYSYLSGRNIDHEIIVVENNSRDKTVDIVNSLTAQIPTLQLYQLQVEPGKSAKGFAVRKGMIKAKGDFKLIMDADNSTTVDHIEKMMPYFDQGYDVVIGSIALAGAIVAGGSEPGWRKLFGKMGNLFIQIMAVPGIHDTQRGFKIFRANAAEDIFPKMTIDGWGWDIEALALARKFKHKIKEVPVNWKNDITHSKVTLKAYFQVLMETMLVRWNLITGKYN
jgi:dolichyl-phosphate beta-glucosyltransferase